MFDIMKNFPKFCHHYIYTCPAMHWPRLSSDHMFGRTPGRCPDLSDKTVVLLRILVKIYKNILKGSNTPKNGPAHRQMVLTKNVPF